MTLPAFPLRSRDGRALASIASHTNGRGGVGFVAQVAIMGTDGIQRDQVLAPMHANYEGAYAAAVAVVAEHDRATVRPAGCTDGGDRLTA